MKPQEKASELVEKYYQSNLNYWFNKNTSKKCAKIAVNEIIENFGLTASGQTFYTEFRAVEFYKEVLNEIDKL